MTALKIGWICLIVIANIYSSIGYVTSGLVFGIDLSARKLTTYGRMDYWLQDEILNWTWYLVKDGSDQGHLLSI